MSRIKNFPTLVEVKEHNEEERIKNAHCEYCLDAEPNNDGYDCQKCCAHEFDSCEGGMCLNCSAEGHDYFDEDYGRDR